MKGIRLLMLLSMFVVVFAGCASKESVEETTEPEATESMEMAPAPDSTQAADSSAVEQG